MNNEYKEMCPKCKGNISDITYDDAVGQKDIGGEYGIVNIFNCPHCGAEFDSLTVLYERR